MPAEILKPFGPSILKVNIPDEIVSDMNKYVDNLILNQDKITNLDHGKYLEGNVHREFRLDLEFMQKIKWPEFLASSCQKWLLEGHNIALKKFDIIASWIIQQYKNDYNPSYMMHTVYPFLESTEERRSVSINAKIDEDAARLR